MLNIIHNNENIVQFVINSKKANEMKYCEHIARLANEFPGCPVNITPPKLPTSYHQTEINELVRELEITEEEAKVLQNKMDCWFNFWYAGDDFDKAHKWTFDGYDAYSDFNFKEFLLAMICEKIGKYHGEGDHESAKELENMTFLHKHIHFDENYVTIKGGDYGVWSWGKKRWDDPNWDC